MKGECLKLLSILRSQLAAHLAPWHLQNMAMPLEDAWNWERSRTESREKPYPLFLVRDHVKNPEQHCEGVAADGFTIASTRDPSISCNVFCVFIIIIMFFFFLTALRRRTHNWYLAIIALETSTTNKFPSCQVSLWSCFFCTDPVNIDVISCCRGEISQSQHWDALKFLITLYNIV